MEYRTVGSFISDWTDNISKGGMFLRSESPLRPGSQLRLVFSLPGNPVLFDIIGEVRWVRRAKRGQGAGMGIEFTGLDENIRDRIERFLKMNQAEGCGPGQQQRQQPAFQDEDTHPRIRISALEPSRRDDESRDE